MLYIYICDPYVVFIIYIYIYIYVYTYVCILYLLIYTQIISMVIIIVYIAYYITYCMWRIPSENMICGCVWTWLYIQHSPMIEDWNQVALGPRILESQPNLTCPWFCAVLIQSVCVRKRDLEVPWGTASFIKSKVLFFQNWKCWMSATWVVKQEKSEIGIRPTFGL